MSEQRLAVRVKAENDWWARVKHPIDDIVDETIARFGFAAGFEAGQGPTPLQAAALAALVAWRRVGLSFDRTNFDSWPDWHEQWEASEEALRTTADALLAAEGGTG